MRQALQKNQTIRLLSESMGIEEFTINNICGLGASSIVYDAQRQNGENVRIKELYPVSVECERLSTGEILVKDNSKFEVLRQQFVRGYRLQFELRKNESLTNSIIPAAGLYSGNGTLYIISTKMVGQNLEENPATSIGSLLKIVISVSNVIGVYHDLGYLHLDIKPSNIFRIPETDEHIMMFDFDSLVEKHQLVDNEKLMLGYSPDWAAPELKHGNWNKICEATDVYAIGCIVFSGLFGRSVAVEDREKFASWDYKKTVCGMLDNVGADIYNQLDDFFHKTLSSNVNRRYPSMVAVIASLKEMLKTSNQNNCLVYPGIDNVQATFIGKEDEILEIDKMLDNNPVLSITGMDGIGKTETVKNYAQKYRAKYNRIIMLDYNNSLLETIVSDGIKINKFERRADQTLDEYYHEKISALSKNLSAQDLLIIDNYSDNDINRIQDVLNLPCKKIFTTTYNMNDYGIPCLEISRLDDSEITELFCTYNKESYDEDNLKALRELYIKYENHTMSIILLAKYFQYSGMMPVELVNRLNTTPSTAFEEVYVKGCVKGKYASATVVDHLKRLYDTLELNEDELEIMMGLSLLGNAKISIGLYRLLFDWANSINQLNGLIDKGWIRFEKENSKIFLHPLVQQIVSWEDITTARCNRFIRSFIEEFDKRNIGYEYQIWKSLLNTVQKSVSGDDILYAALCIREGSYESNIRATEIYKNSGLPGDFLATSIKVLKQDLSSIIDGLRIDDWAPKSNEDTEYKVKQCINQFIDRINYDIHENCIALPAETKCQYFMDICTAMCDAIGYNINYLMVVKPRENICKKLASFISDLLDEVATSIMNSNFSSDIATDLFTNLEKFYIPDSGYDLIDNYIVDEGKAVWIKHELRKYREVYPERYASLSVYDKDAGFRTYSFSDDDRLTLNEATGEKIWEDMWYDTELSFYPFIKEDDESNNPNRTFYKREEIKAMMRQDDVDDTWYEYYCAMKDSKSASVEDAYRIWMKAFSSYYYDMRFSYSGAKDMAMRCLNHISKEILFDRNVDEYCGLTIDLGLLKECRECYCRAIHNLLEDTKSSALENFWGMNSLATYAIKAKNEDDAIYFLLTAVIYLLQPESLPECVEYSFDKSKDSLYLALQNILQKSASKEHVNAIDLMVENQILLLIKDKYKRFYLILQAFLRKEKYKEVEFIVS